MWRDKLKQEEVVSNRLSRKLDKKRIHFYWEFPGL